MGRGERERGGTREGVGRRGDERSRGGGEGEGKGRKEVEGKGGEEGGEERGRGEGRGRGEDIENDGLPQMDHMVYYSKNYIL